MSLIISKYDHDTLTDKCWYDSSNIVYSEVLDKKDAYKDLKVTFKDGRTYLYKDLIVQDYLFFKNHDSQGKALNQYIACNKGGKPKYAFEKLDKVDLSLLENEKKLLIEERDRASKLINENQK